MLVLTVLLSVVALASVAYAAMGRDSLRRASALVVALLCLVGMYAVLDLGVDLEERQAQTGLTAIVMGALALGSAVYAALIRESVKAATAIMLTFLSLAFFYAVLRGGYGVGGEPFFFVVFGAAAVVSAIFVVTAKNPINSAIALIATFLSLAGIYVLLNAHFLAIIQVLVYAGAIMVLFLFVIMLLNLRDADLGERRLNFLKILGGLIAAGVLVAFGTWFASGEGPIPNGQTRLDNTAIAEGWGGIAGVGQTLFTDYLLPFEIASILLLVAIVGAVLIAQRKA